LGVPGKAGSSNINGHATEGVKGNRQQSLLCS